MANIPEDRLTVSQKETARKLKRPLSEYSQIAEGDNVDARRHIALMLMAKMSRTPDISKQIFNFKERPSGNLSPYESVSRQMDRYNNALTNSYDISKIKNRATFRQAVDELEPYAKVMEKNIQSKKQELKFINPNLRR